MASLSNLTQRLKDQFLKEVESLKQRGANVVSNYNKTGNLVKIPEITRQDLLDTSPKGGFSLGGKMLATAAGTLVNSGARIGQGAVDYAYGQQARPTTNFREEVNRLTPLIKQSARTGLQVQGIASPKTLIPFAAVNTGIQSFSRDNGKINFSPIRGVQETQKDFGRISEMSGLMSGTNPATEKLLKTAKITKFVPKNIITGLSNVGEDLALGKLRNEDVSREQMLASFLTPAVMDSLGIVTRSTFKSSGEAVRRAQAVIKELTGQDFRTKKGSFTTKEKYIKGTRAYFKNNEAMGLMAGIEPYQDEEGNWKVRFNPQKAALGVGAVAVGGRIKGAGLDPLIQEAVKSGVRDSNFQEVLQDAKKSIGPQADKVRVPLKQRWKEFYSQAVNRFQPIEDAVSRVEKENKLSIRPEFNPTYAIKRFLGAGGTAELRHRKTLDPIINKLGDVDKLDFDLFLKAKRDVELAGRGIKGSDASQAKTILNSLSQKYGEEFSTMENTAKELYKYQSDNLAKLFESGFLSKESVDAIRSKNKYYVPYERVMDEVDNYLGMPSKTAQQSASPIKGIKGSIRNIYSPLESIVTNTYKTEAAIAKNRVAESLATLGDNFPDLGIEKITGKAGNAPTISVWRNGKKQLYRVPQELETAIKGLDEESSNLLVEIASIPAKILRQQATGRNLEFMIPNVVRDQMDAAINSKYGYVPFVDYFNGMFHLLKYKMGMGDDVVEAWMRSGGKMSFESMSGRRGIAEELFGATKRKGAIKTLKDWAISGIDTVGEFSEIPTRLGIFNKALKRTGNELIAAMQSREGTLDFARMGSKMKAANSLIPFLNVGVQGFDRMIRTVKGNPKRTAIVLTAYAGIPALTTGLYNALYHKDEYAQVPDFVKDSNFVIMTGETDADGNPKYISIPKGHIVSMVANPTEQFVNYMFQVNPKTASQFALSFLTSSLPVIGEGDNPKEVISRTVGNLTPQAIKPPLEAVANYSFFKNKPIVSGWMTNRPPELQTGKYTPEIYNKLGRALNMSPLKIQNTLEGYLAGGIKQPIMVNQILNKLQNGEDINPNDIPIIRRFIGSYSGFDNDRPESTGEGVNLGELFGTAEASTELPQNDIEKSPQSSFMDRLFGVSKDETKEISPERLLNKVWSGSMKSGFSGNTYIYKDPDQDKPKTVDLTEFMKAPTNPVEKVRWEEDRFKAGLSVYRNKDIPEGDKNALYSMIEMKPDELAYYDIATDSVDVRIAFLLEQTKKIKTTDRSSLLNELAKFRVEVREQKVLTDTTITKLIDRGIISKDEGASLKAVGKSSSKKGKKAKGVRVSMKKPDAITTVIRKQPLTKLPILKVKKPKLAALKVSKPQNIVVRRKKYAKIKAKGFINTLNTGSTKLV